MLKLPSEWRAMSAGYLAVALMNQVSDTLERTDVARNLIQAAFDVCARESRAIDTAYSHVREAPRLTWRFGDVRYVYVPVVDDTTVHEWANSNPSPATTILVTPDRMSEMFDSALSMKLGSRAPSVMSIYSLVAMRLDLSTSDSRLEMKTMLTKYFSCYNTLVSAEDRRQLRIDYYGDSAEPNTSR